LIQIGPAPRVRCCDKGDRSALTRNSATASHILIEPEPLSGNRDHSLASRPHAAEPDVSVFSPVRARATRRVGCLSQEFSPSIASVVDAYSLAQSGRHAGLISALGESRELPM
jgi:hypothetical protein